MTGRHSADEPITYEDLFATHPDLQPLRHWNDNGWPACGLTDPGELFAGTPDQVTCADCYPYLPLYLGQHQYQQVRWTAQYLAGQAAHGTHPSAPARAAVMLRARPDDPACTKFGGLLIDTAREGKRVRCSGCGQRYDCLPENPAFTDPGDPKTLLCLMCVLVETRPPAMTEVLEATVILPPRKKRARTPPAIEDQP